MQGAKLSWLFTKPHTVISLQNFALCEADYRPHGNEGTLMKKHNANKKFKVYEPWIYPVLMLQNIFCVRETVILSPFFVFFFYFYVIETFFWIIFWCLLLFSVVTEDQNCRKTKARTIYAMQCSVCEAQGSKNVHKMQKHRV